MLYAAVVLVQDKRLFGSAPKDIVDAIQPREERFKGARFLGWALVILSMCILVAVAVIGICHPAVIKMEYYLGKKSWWIWLVVGLIVAAAGGNVRLAQAECKTTFAQPGQNKYNPIHNL